MSRQGTKRKPEDEPEGHVHRRYKLGAGDWALPAQHSELVNDQGQIQSDGRGQPTAEQAYVMETCFVPKDFAERRKIHHESQCLAPSGSTGAKSIRVGELVFTELPTRHSSSDTEVYTPYESNMRPPEADQGIGGFTDVPVFSCVNGLHRKAEIRCVGQAYTMINENDASRDTACTVKTRGMATVVNTGPYTLKPGDIVGFTKTPAAIIDENGRMIPRVVVKGVEPDKFYPALFPITEMLSAAIKLKCVTGVKKTVDEAGAGLDAKNFDTLFVTAKNRIRTDYAVGDVTDPIPLDYYIKYQLLIYMAAAGRNEMKEALIAKLKTVRNAHVHDATSTNSSNYLDETKVDKDVTGDGAQFMHKLNLWSLEALCEHDAYVNSHKIGRVVKISPAGQPLHIDLGNFSA